MAFTRSVPVCTVLCLLVLIAVASSGNRGSERGTSFSTSFTCNQVRELFEGGIGSPAALHSQPEQETESSICRRGEATGEHSCCSADTETSFLEVMEKRVKGNVRVRNNLLKKRLNIFLARYQDRLRLLNAEAENRTADFLSRLHKIPWAEHRPVVANLFRGLQALVTNGGGVGGPEDVVSDFFVNLFPAVFNYVLSGREQGEERRPINANYHACLKRYADQIQPFGNQPERLLRYLKRSLRHALVFQEALKTLMEAMSSTGAASMDSSCRQALVRLQVCPGCRGVSLQAPVVKPCRGLCLNVMRGCLAKMSEISSSWDDLVIAFETLQVGLLGRHDLQKMLLYLDMNVSDAIMMALDDSPRIYDEVRVKCKDVPRAADTDSDSAGALAPLPLLPDGDASSDTIAPRSTHMLRDFRQEMRALVKELDDSKGRFNRLPDSLCEDEKVYAADMLSDTCWNGTSVGRYLEQVPEANFLSQVQRNKEVKVSLVDPDFRFLQVKESLTHMRRNLSGLLNADVMQGDSPLGMAGSYRSVDREGSGGRLYHHDVIVDDEDLVAYGSGSGSGSGDGGDDEGDRDTTKPIEPPVTRRPTRPPPSSGTVLNVPAVLLSLGLCLHTVLFALH